MGKLMPPLYGIEDAVKIVNKINDIDVKINALFIQREQYVADLKKAIEEKNTTKA